ncbi:DnaJ domain-containing protein [Nitrosopumilus sp. b1]|uniref:DnaJ domain-containing protein n=1 Tax=Nitrosopumilus sp. b1 TaxID=2109907 RepID=UPI002106581F|nr:DnaJ domain-containing protein [Nitrosopumilus sp. b1]
MKKFLLVGFAYLMFIQGAYAQESNATDDVPDLTMTELIILFSVSIIVVTGIILYITREIIFRKKLEYDKKNLDSKKDRDYEKYHSDWTDDYEDFTSKKKKFDDNFRKDLEESNLPNFYEVLGVPKTATQIEIKTKFRQLAKELHPDKTKDKSSEDKMSEINRAYEVLSDPDKKEQYDKYLS